MGSAWTTEGASGRVAAAAPAESRATVSFILRLACSRGTRQAAAEKNKEVKTRGLTTSFTECSRSTHADNAATDERIPMGYWWQQAQAKGELKRQGKRSKGTHMEFVHHL